MKFESKWIALVASTVIVCAAVLAAMGQEWQTFLLAVTSVFFGSTGLVSLHQQREMQAQVNSIEKQTNGHLTAKDKQIRELIDVIKKLPPLED
jgi:uncharacterized membrane protein